MGKTCKQCGSNRVAGVSGKVSDLCCVDIFEFAPNSDYVPGDMGIGGGDYIYFNYCLNCGHIVGRWPIPKTKLEKDA